MSNNTPSSCPIRVLHLVPHARKLGGTERSLLDLVTSRTLFGVQQRVAFVQPGRVRGFSADHTVKGAEIGFPAAAFAVLVGWRPDILHGWLLQGNLAGALLKYIQPGVALITSERNVGHLTSPVKRRIERLVARAEDIGTANSVAVRDAMIARTPLRGHRVRVIPPGVPAPRRPKVTSAATAVMVGRLHPVKDHSTAIRAWRRVVDRHPTATLAIVGDGAERKKLVHEAARLDLAENVTFIGEADPAPHLYGARVFLQSSRAEGFSRALLEALGAGLPAVSTMVGGVTELPGRTVRRVPIGDDAALASELLGLLEDPDALRAASLDAPEVAARYAPEMCHASYAALYSELVADGVHRRQTGRPLPFVGDR